MTIEGTDKAKNNHLFFRAPQPNEEPADGRLVRLTEAPRFRNDGSRYDEFWSKPITIHSAAVTYVEEIELNCYESHQYRGSRIYLIGLVSKELSESDKRFFCEGIPALCGKRERFAGARDEPQVSRHSVLA